MVLSVSIIEIFNFGYWNIQIFEGTMCANNEWIFQVKPSTPCSLSDKNKLYSKNAKTMTYETELISFSVPKIWSTVPQELEKCKSLDI